MKIDEFVDGCCKTSSRRLVAGNIKLMPATKSFVTQIPLAASSARRRSSNYARFSIFTARKLMLFCNPYIVLSWGFRLSVKVNDVVGNEAILLPRKIMKLLFFRSRSPTSTIILLLEKKQSQQSLEFWFFLSIPIKDHFFLSLPRNKSGLHVPSSPISTN